jgi:alcohol dehydrogenase class IV
MGSFEFSTATRILFGEGVFQEAAMIARTMGERALIVYGWKGQAYEQLEKNLAAQEIDSILFEVVSEPTVGLVEQCVHLVKEKACDLVISLGGGSTIDTGKAVSALVTNPGDVHAYLEVIGGGQAITKPALPFLAIPTTAGTGAEVTRNAVLGSPEHGVKVSLRSPLMLPKVALVDPELTYSLPASITAYTGLDALTQLIEPFVSISSNPLTDALCREGIDRASRSLRKAYLDRGDKLARRELSLASLFGGLALANAKLGAVHGFAGPLGGLFPVPHGAICARLLPIVMEMNIDALQKRLPDSIALLRYYEIARLVTGKANATAMDGVKWVEELCADLKIACLAAYGVSRESLPVVAEMAAKSSSMKGNPIALTMSEMLEVLDRAMEE